MYNQSKGQLQFARTFIYLPYIRDPPNQPQASPHSTQHEGRNGHGRPSRASYRAIGVSAKDKGGQAATREENWSAT